MTTVTLGPVPGGSTGLDGYLAVPEGDGPWPGVVVVHEVWGLDDVMRRQADRLAAAGFLTLAPNLFADGGAKRCVVTTLRSLMKADGKPFADLEAARTWLSAEPRCTGKVGMVGFCMGGGFALVCTSRGYDAVSANYGVLPKDMSFAQASPVVASYGLKDRALRSAPAKLERALTAAGVAHDVKGYVDSGHSFLNDAPTGPKVLQPIMKVMGIGPSPDDAADAWGRIDAFLAEHLA